MMEGIKNIAILGAGESGTGAAKLAVKQGLNVYISDKGVINDNFMRDLDELNVDWESGSHNTEKIMAADLIVKSPGIPGDIDILQQATEQGIPVVSEIEFGYQYCQGKIIAVTGSNGKTTTANLIFHMLEKAGRDVVLCGNVGKSFAGILSSEKHEIYVLEISSFQLDDILEFKPDIGIVLNITPDHLDRYQDKLENYTRAKMRIAENQDDNDFFIYNLDDEIILNALKKESAKSKHLPFSLKKKGHEGAWLEEKQIIINLNNNPLAMSIHDLALQGKHNIYNSMAAAIAGRILDLRKELIRESLSDFQNVEHRLEFVMKVHGISFINDSKATNVNSTWYALESIPQKIVWIAGGVDKGNDYSQLNELVADKVTAIVCLGKDNKKLKSAFKSIVPDIVETQSASDAVKQAYSLAKHGDTVLLSPACASFDLFENYEDRGYQFKQAVKGL